MNTPRFLLIVLVCHTAITLVLGYVVAPRFDTSVEPPTPRPAYAPLLHGVIDAFDFPVVVWARRSLITGISRPGISYVLAKSALVTLIITGSVVWWQRRRRAVA